MSAASPAVMPINRSLMLVLMLVILNFCTAVAVVYFKHLSRQNHALISSSQQLIDALEVQWNQLQIEEGTFSEYGRVERTARESLGMEMPDVNATIMIER